MAAFGHHLVIIFVILDHFVVNAGPSGVFFSLTILALIYDEFSHRVRLHYASLLTLNSLVLVTIVLNDL